MQISIQIIIAALSVLGLYFCLKTMASLIFTDHRIRVAVIIESKEDLKNLDILLKDASSTLFCSGKRISVLIPQEVWTVCLESEKLEVKKEADSTGAEIYFLCATDS